VGEQQKNKSGLRYKSSPTKNSTWFGAFSFGEALFGCTGQSRILNECQANEPDFPANYVKMKSIYSGRMK
jgi:hypothetical protein